jgi:hypothetical protein
MSHKGLRKVATSRKKFLILLVTINLLFAQSHHSIDDTGGEHKTTAKKTAKAWTQDHRDNCESKSKINIFFSTF